MAKHHLLETPRKYKNGVDVTAIAETVEAITLNPAVAVFKFRNQNTWIDGSVNRSAMTGLYGALEEREHSPAFVYENDEPHVLLGTDKAPNPVEWILHALAGCITTTTVYHAAAQGIRIDEMSTRLEGELDLRGFLNMPGAERSGYKNVKVEVKIKGDASKEDLESLVTLAQSLSPAFNTITHGTKIDLKINAA